jgi:two-component system sensor histidine kinase/response regulator
VLVVEDDPAIRSLMAVLMRKAGLVIDVAGNGLEALTALEKRDYAVILLDLNMPVMDGFAFLRELRGRCERSGQKPLVVVVSAALESSDVVARIDTDLVGAAIRKPFDPAHLQSVVSMYVAAVTEGDPLGKLDPDVPFKELN